MIIIIIIIIRTITILNSYNLYININLIKVINKYKNYNYFYKSLKELALYKNNFTTLSSSLKVTIVIFSFNILLKDKTINRIKENKIKIIKRNLVPKSKIFKTNSKYFKYIFEVACWVLLHSEKINILKSVIEVIIS
ncbi:hypothetical protein C8035_v004829 [Colletotrichum spinosum]|uniref:Uncharacterized protein n=1 Tax=Colletotrichum spinosum TaxID=1347390 RepID=A0A4V3HQZ3_9PEZI|nr:hypothetical protein C8035_v004829 [Colletotrichum spinosum]